ncbi:primosomal replication protein N [Nitrosomonas sp. Nm34]|uniref:primosomal replication protein N n=1 Tax=Nitrosomonas sp. Nm34 TaxID=1881055 RepID=UPI0008E1723C|nr:primosomal replication protein N [Nitrosomonas sp. Nm34]SFI92859.1 restart primosome assembly protein PriB [Nitrosomonas sp. Nm34]
MNYNQTVICGKIIRIDPLRYTPVGKAVIEFEVSHASRQIEAGIERLVICKIFAVALADMAKAISGLEVGSSVKLTGFLAKRNKISSQLALHVAHIDIL